MRLLSLRFQAEESLLWQLLDFFSALLVTEALEQDTADSETLSIVVRDRTEIFAEAAWVSSIYGATWMNSTNGGCVGD